MVYRVIAVSLLALLTACTDVPYDPDTGASDVAVDLHMDESQTKIFSKCNYFPFAYGPTYPQRMQPCLFLVNDDNVYFVDRDKETNRYFAEFIVPFSQVDCATVIKEDPGKGMLQLLTRQRAYSIALFEPNNDLNHTAVRAFIEFLSEHSINTLTVEGTIGNPLMPESVDIVSPCNSASR